MNHVLTKSVVILGAGASKGAVLTGKLNPPLDAEFLGAARNFFKKKRESAWRTHHKVWNELNRYLKKAGLEFDDIQNWRLEQLSTFLEARSELTGLQMNKGHPVEYKNALVALKGVVASVLIQSGGFGVCKLHSRLIERSSPHAIVSFNYDLIADQTLASLGRLKWDAQTYCGDRVMRVRRNVHRMPVLFEVPRYRGVNSVPLLKLHGSINWERLPKSGSGAHRLIGVVPMFDLEDSLEAQFYTKEPFIIPPIAAKTEIPEALSVIWREAMRRLHSATEWIIWGYSFPMTDTISQVLFRSALVGHVKPKTVVIINPDYGAAGRAKDVCGNVSIKYYPSMERFLLERQWMQI
ncbi:MAG TPA: hypothetical protein VF471_07570 [Pseudoxanthomonas sp.]